MAAYWLLLLREVPVIVGRLAELFIVIEWIFEQYRTQTLLPLFFIGHFMPLFEALCVKVQAVLSHLAEKVLYLSHFSPRPTHAAVHPILSVKALLNALVSVMDSLPCDRILDAFRSFHLRRRDFDAFSYISIRGDVLFLGRNLSDDYRAVLCRESRTSTSLCTRRLAFLISVCYA